MEVFYVFFQCFHLSGCPGVFWRFAVPTYTTGINYMPADSIVTGSPVCNLPRVNIGIFIVLYQPFNRSIQVEQICISYSFQPRPPLEVGFVCHAFMSAAVTSRPSGVAVQWITKYCNFAILLITVCFVDTWQIIHP